ncbi:type II toxin-antitoxin system RelE/ParE family toxin [Phytoactinopolyspora endophytica]|uniref:type II toxin-antitoxin system RelE/ParE family toxin n=1 Tax=Phytoactinopolyspora endophytica TaxID=1642495 RepID=UPI0013ECCACD|nr:type II toxin-antitoxin system RelE/ParE family toxin [Phytoactinopolyspora endophytica]
MRLAFDDEHLRRLYEEAGFNHPRFGRDLVRSFRKKVNLIGAATNEFELRQHKALHLEKLKGDRDGQHSIRLNGQYRLILRFDTDDDGKIVVVIEIVDYH